MPTKPKDFDAWIEALRAVPDGEKLEILELLSLLSENGKPPESGILPDEAQATRANAALLRKGYESTLSESARTQAPYHLVEKGYRGADYLIRNAMSTLHMFGRTPARFGKMSRRLARKAGYVPRHGGWDD